MSIRDRIQLKMTHIDTVDISDWINSNGGPSEDMSVSKRHLVVTD